MSEKADRRYNGKVGDATGAVYAVRGFLTVRRRRARVPLSGEFRLRADPGPAGSSRTGRFTGELSLDPAVVERAVFGVRVLRATVLIEATAPAAVEVDAADRMSATVTVGAVLETVQVAGQTLLRGATCRTIANAVVTLRSGPGFSMERGGRAAGVYDRPPFTGCGRLTPLVNLLISGPGNAVVVDLVPRAS